MGIEAVEIPAFRGHGLTRFCGHLFIEDAETKCLGGFDLLRRLSQTNPKVSRFDVDRPPVVGRGHRHAGLRQAGLATAASRFLAQRNAVKLEPVSNQAVAERLGHQALESLDLAVGELDDFRRF